MHRLGKRGFLDRAIRVSILYGSDGRMLMYPRITFQKQFKDQILSGRKTQTRRLYSRSPKKEGLIYATTNRFDDDALFAQLLIKDVRIWLDYYNRFISEEDAIAEGFDTPNDFWMTFDNLTNKHRIRNGVKYGYLKPYVIEFALYATWDKDGNKVKHLGVPHWENKKINIDREWEQDDER